MSRASAVSGGGAGSYYGRERFQPSLIVAQIVCIQACFYATFATMLFVLNHTLGVSSIYTPGRTGPLILDQMLSYRALSFETSSGIVAIVSFAMSSVLCCSLAFVSLVGRSKRALDFAATFALAHLACCSLYGGIPTTGLWWTLNAICTIAMTVTCEVLSRRLEMREIAVPARDLENQSCDDDEDAIRPA